MAEMVQEGVYPYIYMRKVDHWGGNNNFDNDIDGNSDHCVIA